MPTNEKVKQTYNSKEMTRTKIELIEYLGLQRIVFFKIEISYGNNALICPDCPISQQED